MRSADRACGATRLGLGTVQFGLDYGVTNSAGRVPEDEVARILQTASAAGIDTLDTAALYGDSEAVIGRSPGSLHFRIVSKTAKFDNVSDPIEAADQFRVTLQQSLAQTKRTVLDALMFHQASDLLGYNGPSLWRAMQQAKDEGLVTTIGVSVYDGDEIDAVLARYPVEIVQLPLNAIDHRLIEGGQIDRLADRGIETHARSALLQGVLTVPPEGLEPRFAPLRPVIEAMRSRCAEHRISLLALLLGAVLRHDAISRLIVGATNAAELNQLISAAQAAVAETTAIDYNEFKVSDKRLLNPALWHTLS